jgi:hypothetical protein
MTKPKKENNALEGEGSYTAARRYDAGVQKPVAPGQSAKLGQEAKKALQGPEGELLREAERIGKAGNPKVKH